MVFASSRRIYVSILWSLRFRSCRPAHPEWVPPQIQFLYVETQLSYRFLQSRPHGRPPCELLWVAGTCFPRGLPPPDHAHAGHTDSGLTPYARDERGGAASIAVRRSPLQSERVH